MLESLFNKVAGIQVFSFIEKRLQHWCFLGKFEKFSRAPFSYRTPLVATSAACMEVDVRNCKLESISVNCYVTIFMASSIDPIYQGVSSV